MINGTPEAQAIRGMLAKDGYYIRRKLFTSDRIEATGNAGNIFFELTETPMSMGESFRHSFVGVALGGFISRRAG